MHFRDVGETVVVGERPVVAVAHGDLRVAAAEPVEHIGGDRRVALGREPLAHPQQLLGHAVALHHDDEGGTTLGALGGAGQEVRGRDHRASSALAANVSAKRSRSTFFWTLPIALRGSSSTRYTARGSL